MELIEVESRTPRVAGVAVAAALAMLVYAAMWIGYVRNWAWLNAIDNAWLDTLHDFGATRPGWVSFWATLSIMLQPKVFQVFGLICIVVSVVRRKYRTALYLFVSVELMGLVLVFAKWLVARPRPSTAFVFDSSTSFPSGHAFCTTAGLLALGTVLWPVIEQRWRVFVAVAGVALILLVGFARVALNVHHPSDVLAGWALGFAYYTAIAAVFARTSRRRL